MSKIGRRPIEVGDAKVEIKGNEVHYSGKKSSGVYVLPQELNIVLDGKQLKISAEDKFNSEVRRVWGLHRALLSNIIKGSDSDFEKKIKINGLGFKAIVSGSKVQFSLGFSHKIDLNLPKDVTIETDKSGQLLTVKSFNKDLLGKICSEIRSFRPPEPYKGTGIQYTTEVILRKAGKTKSA